MYSLHKMSTLKTKTYHGNEERKYAYFCIVVNTSRKCLVYNATLALLKKDNLEKHFMTCHTQFQANYPLGSEVRRVQLVYLTEKMSENVAD